MSTIGRFLAALAGAVILVTASAALAPPRASAAGTTDPVTTFTKTADVRITMRDGIRLDFDEYVPDSGCPCPVILVQTPYRKSDSTVAEYNPYFPLHGYAEIVVDVRGTGSSEGYWTSFGHGRAAGWRPAGAVGREVAAFLERVGRVRRGELQRDQPVPPPVEQPGSAGGQGDLPDRADG